MTCITKAILRQYLPLDRSTNPYSSVSTTHWHSPWLTNLNGCVVCIVVLSAKVSVSFLKGTWRRKWRNLRKSTFATSIASGQGSTWQLSSVV